MIIADISLFDIYNLHLLAFTYAFIFSVIVVSYNGDAHTLCLVQVKMFYQNHPDFSDYHMLSTPHLLPSYILVSKARSNFDNIAYLHFTDTYVPLINQFMYQQALSSANSLCQVSFKLRPRRKK